MISHEFNLPKDFELLRVSKHKKHLDILTQYFENISLFQKSKPILITQYLNIVTFWENK